MSNTPKPLHELTPAQRAIIAALLEAKRLAELAPRDSAQPATTAHPNGNARLAASCDEMTAAHPRPQRTVASRRSRRVPDLEPAK